MKFPMWQVDAFSNRRFGGNPAAVVLLDQWLSDNVLLAIAAENNLAETAFLVPQGEDYQIRWLTPLVEVPLCGHATLAAAWVVYHRLQPSRERIVFHSKSGALPVDRLSDRLILDFPSNEVRPARSDQGVAEALGARPYELHEDFQWLALYRTEEEVRDLRPDMQRLLDTGIHGVIATAPGKDCDFVSRFFAPKAGVPEDPVTGSAHTRLVPFWSSRLGKTNIYARQISARGGELWCELRDGRVRMAGNAVLYLEGAIEV